MLRSCIIEANDERWFRYSIMKIRKIFDETVSLEVLARSNLAKYLLYYSKVNV